MFFKRILITSNEVYFRIERILLPILHLERQLIEVEGVKTPAGIAGQVRPRRSVSDEEAHRLPAESETPGTEINTLFLKIKKL